MQRAIEDLQHTAGNAAVAGFIQRLPAAPDRTKGQRWNDGGAYGIGKMWRVMVTGLKGGESGKWRGGDSQHTDEDADHRAVVIVPDGFKPKEPTEVLLHFHGHTETWRGHHAGFRERTFKKTTETAKHKLTSDGTVRDVALDQIEQQMQNSGHPQMLGILPQGGPQNQFGSIPGDDYIKDVLEKAHAAKPSVLKGVPDGWSVVLSGHSGGGFYVAALADGSKFKQLNAIVLFDAEGMQGDIQRRLSVDLAKLGNVKLTDADRTAYLKGRPALRVVARKGGKYGGMYETVVDDAIGRWQARNRVSARQASRLAALEARASCATGSTCKPLNRSEQKDLDSLVERRERFDAVTRLLPLVRSTYRVKIVDPTTMSHEELIRGADKGSGAYVKGQGNLEEALVSVR